MNEFERPHDHDVIDPAIFYFGTPVVLLSTIAADGTTNLAPMSSVFWLGNRAVLGMGSRSQTARNLLETGECVLNLPSVDQVDAVDRLALTTGRPEVNESKRHVGYRFEDDKFGRAGLTPVPSMSVSAPRAQECPVHLEGRVSAHYPLPASEHGHPSAYLFEVEISRVHVSPAVRDPTRSNHIDPDRWRPLIMSFQKFYGLGPQVHESRLSTIDENWYR